MVPQLVLAARSPVWGVLPVPQGSPAHLSRSGDLPVGEMRPTGVNGAATQNPRQERSGAPGIRLREKYDAQRGIERLPRPAMEPRRGRHDPPAYSRSQKSSVGTSAFPDETQTPRTVTNARSHWTRQQDRCFWLVIGHHVRHSSWQ